MITTTVRLEKGECVDNLSCYRSDGSHCKIYGPATITTTKWPDGGVDQYVEYDNDNDN